MNEGNYRESGNENCRHASSRPVDLPMGPFWRVGRASMADGDAAICLLDVRPPAPGNVQPDAGQLRGLPSLGADIERRAGGRVLRHGFRVTPPLEPFQPVVAEQLHGVWRADGAIPARQVIRGAELVAPPADSLRVSRVQRGRLVLHDDYRSSFSSRAALGNRMLFSRWTCWCRSRSNASSSCRHTRYVVHAPSGIA